MKLKPLIGIDMSSLIMKKKMSTVFIILNFIKYLMKKNVGNLHENNEK